MSHQTTDLGNLQPVTIISQNRRTLAMWVTPAGIQVLIPAELDADSPRVQAFIETGLQKLKPPEPNTSYELLTAEDLNELVTVWSEHLGVEIKRVQVRTMRNKWASCSSNGILTLSTDLLELPLDLVDYVLCHELAHLKVPNHGKGFRALMGCYIPDWENRQLRLARWIHFPLSKSHVAQEQRS
jgi:hypothetical protein